MKRLSLRLDRAVVAWVFLAALCEVVRFLALEAL